MASKTAPVTIALHLGNTIDTREDLGAAFQLIQPHSMKLIKGYNQLDNSELIKIL